MKKCFLLLGILFVMLLLILTACASKIDSKTSVSSSDLSEISLSHSSLPQEINISQDESTDSSLSSSSQSNSQIVSLGSSIASSQANSAPSYPIINSEVPPSPEVIKKTVNLKITAIDEVLFNGKVEWQEKDTAFSIILRYATDNDIDVKYTSYLGGKYLSGFAGYKEKASGSDAATSGWIFYYNGERGKKSSSSQKVNPDDDVLWAYSLSNNLN